MKKTSRFLLNNSARRGMFWFTILIFFISICLGFFKNNVSVEKYKVYIFVSSTNKKINYPSSKPISKFNPNSFSKNDWIVMGFSPKQAASIINYKRSIGGFYSQGELYSCFVISDYWKNRWKNKLIFSPRPPKSKIVNKSIVKLNTATVKQLSLLKGIGEYRAQKIVEYRKRLGGFYSKKQLNEIWHIPDNIWGENQKRIQIDTVELKKIELNTTSLQTLTQHPYISSWDAQNIVDFRNENYLERVEDILNFGIISKKKFEKIKPYLTVEKQTNEF